MTYKTLSGNLRKTVSAVAVIGLARLQNLETLEFFSHKWNIELCFYWKTFMFEQSIVKK